MECVSNGTDQPVHLFSLISLRFELGGKQRISEDSNQTGRVLTRVFAELRNYYFIMRLNISTKSNRIVKLKYGHLYSVLIYVSTVHKASST